jgi:hypothetical protein
MVDILTRDSHPNILTVTGDDVFGSDEEYRDRLRDALYRVYEFPHPAVGRPVRRGSHDFWITYRVPGVSGIVPNWSREDMGVSDWDSRRPMRGIILMDLPNDDSDETMVDQIGTLLQEVGHHWLVPRDLKFRSPQGEVGMHDLREIVDIQNNDRGFTRPALLGREHIHWSSYWNAEHSPFDGIFWIERGEHGLARWDQQASPNWSGTQQSRAVQLPGGRIWSPPPPPRTIQLCKI